MDKNEELLEIFGRYNGQAFPTRKYCLAGLHHYDATDTDSPVYKALEDEVAKLGHKLSMLGGPDFDQLTEAGLIEDANPPKAWAEIYQQDATNLTTLHKLILK